MEMYSVSGRNREAYLIQGTKSNPCLTSPPLESFPTMYSEGGPEFLVEPGLYYPTATNYGYICTGFESPGNWDDHHRFFGLDGQEVQYSGAESESLPYVYYSPSYGYAESSYNPYYPYIPGAMLGVDDQSTGPQQYYTFPSYEIPMYSPAYYPTVFQSEPAIISSNGPAPLDTGSLSEKSVDGQGLKNKVPSPATILTVPRPASNHTHSSARASECCKANAGPSELPAAQGNLISGSFSSAPLPHVLQVRGAQAVDNIPPGKTSFRRSQVKMALSSGTGLSNFGSSANGQASVEKSRSKSYHGRVSNDVNGSPDASIQQNRYPRSNQSKNSFAVKAYSTRAGDSDAQGNIIIHSEQYNRDDFPIDYMNAKFFVIKSYSEDDVHKGIKYSVWSSTPNGNKKLQSAYEDASRIATGEKKGCPIFLFFSVNASGQFCGVAEMTGPVDFHKHMDFWQQDKWIGSFPVKWHFIKDVSNPNFRHIILENNENKPVTNSRDTQEIRYKQGIEMLKIFKNYKWKTSLLDDFMYYENRQKIMQEEKNRLLIKGYGSSFLIPALDPPRKHNFIFDMTSGEEQKTTKPSELNGLDSDASSIIIAEGSERIMDEPKDDYISSVKIGSLTINPKDAVSKAEAASNVATVADTRAVEMLTVGSMPVKVNYGNSSGFLTFGTIPIDPPKPVHHVEADYTKSKTHR